MLILSQFYEVAGRYCGSNSMILDEIDENNLKRFHASRKASKGKQCKVRISASARSKIYMRECGLLLIK